ncbi:MAG: hypothetical protein MO853_13335 [Candidatus Protistobacter heckmanni]|nr:hypothetical protein [Candidatus Protistobacter heckmanni]
MDMLTTIARQLLLFAHILAFASAVCASVGAVSSVTWLFASFFGAARLIAPMMTYTGFLSLYGLSLAAGLAVSLTFVRPHLERLMLPRPAPEEKFEEALPSALGSAISQLPYPKSRHVQT